MLISKFDTSNVKAEVFAFEQRYGVKLPDLYKKFILKYNGGYTPETSFKVKPRRTEDVEEFYGFGEVPNSINQYFYLQDMIESGFLPIAQDPWGNDYLIGVRKENYGKIYFYDHERQSVELARNDFNSFVKSCKSEKLDPDVRLSIEERERQLIEDGYGANITDALRQAWQEEIDFYGNMVQEPVILDESEN